MHVCYGQTQVVCFSEGRIYSLVGPWPTHWHLWSAPIGCYRPGTFYPWPEWCPFGLVVWSGPSVGSSGPRVFTWGVLASSHPPPSEIKQGTTSKINYILFNSLLSPVLLNKLSGLVRVKPGNFNLKTLNRAWSVFAEMVTFIRWCTTRNLKQGGIYTYMYHASSHVYEIIDSLKLVIPQWSKH